MTTLLDPPVPAAAGTGGPVSVHVAEDRLVAHPALRLYAALRSRGEPDVFLLEGLEGPGADPGATVLGRGALAELRVVPGRVDLSGRAPLVRAMAAVAEECGLAPQGAVSGADGPVYGYGFTGPDQLWTLLRAVNALFSVTAGPAAEGGPGSRAAGSGYVFGFLATVGYGAAWHMEELPPRTAPEGGWEREPDLVLTLFRQTVWYGSDADGTGAPRLLTATSPYFDDPAPRSAAGGPEAEELRRTAAAVAAGADPLLPVPDAPEPVRVRRTVDEEVFVDRVERALGHIAVGDIYQIQLGHRIEVETALQPFEVYRRLRERNPSPYMFLVPRGPQTLIGASPEVLFRCDDGTLVMRPIAGTAPRSGDAAVDAERIEALTSSEKEQAEHVMLVDLCRNDIGRVCRPTTLETEGMMTVERFSHVFHLVSTVRGELAAGEDVWSVLRATFPAGTVTGAPKIRAMELIHTLEPEPEPRGMYAGGVGLVDTRGWSQLALCIRTVVHDGERYATRSCAGVVADSDPRAEWRETLHKMGAAYWALTGEELQP